ncbi:sensor histidine kinase [Clostridium sp. D2Q-11]|uniref:histidine kinase n=1 Tax=Anaeromonas frigoriresistens TaxID=2683708 RepID=A0A942URH4_9FIRM|nr:sensor histidine kinase [Anaeromonas frigoriresistens]
MINYLKKILFLKIIIVSILFSAAVLYENAGGERLTILVILFFLYVLNGIIRLKLQHKKNLYISSYIFDIVIIFLLENNSRFMINYFIHSIYLILILEVTLTLKRKNGIIIGSITAFISLIKYFFLIYYDTSVTYISEMLFFMLVNIFILVVSNFAHKTREEKEEKDKIYKELLKAHKKLKEYTEEVERLSKTEERNRIARDIHDDLGHNMTALIMKLEMTEHILEEDIEEAKNLLYSSKEMARKGLRDIRNVVETLRRVDINNLKEIDNLIKEFSDHTNVKIYSQIDCSKIALTEEIEETLYKLIKESLTNSVRHGLASEINIEIKCTDKGIGFNIKDNGIGAVQIKKGYGIRGMKERIEKLEGEISFKSNDGFEIKGFIPGEVKE